MWTNEQYIKLLELSHWARLRSKAVKVSYYAHFLVYTIHCCSFSIHLLPNHSVFVSITLLSDPKKAQSALTGQLSQAFAGIARCFGISSAAVFLNHGCAGGVAKGRVCINVTSQLYRNPNNLFKGNVSKYGLAHFRLRLPLIKLD